MVNEDRVKEMFRLEQYESKEDRYSRQVFEYFDVDYFAKEFLKSIFAGTIAFGLMFGLYVLYKGEQIFELFNNPDLLKIGYTVLAIYALFMVLFLLITFLVYRVRLRKEKERLREYAKTLRKVEEMYSRDDKLRS